MAGLVKLPVADDVPMVSGSFWKEPRPLRGGGVRPASLLNLVGAILIAGRAWVVKTRRRKGEVRCEKYNFLIFDKKE